MHPSVCRRRRFSPSQKFHILLTVTIQQYHIERSSMAILGPLNRVTECTSAALGWVLDQYLPLCLLCQYSQKQLTLLAEGNLLLSFGGNLTCLDRRNPVFRVERSGSTGGVLDQYVLVAGLSILGGAIS